MNLPDAVNAGIQTTFLSLPSDILIEIITFLSGQDRQNLGQTHNRLRAVEENAGYRRFNIIEFNYGIRAFDGSRTFSTDTIFPDGKIACSFNHATTDALIIRDQLSRDAKEKLRVFFKTMIFHTLNFEITSKTSCRIFEEAVRNRKGIKTILIRTGFTRTIAEDNRIRHMILCLPAMQNCVIYPSLFHRSAPIIDDEAFLHIVRSSSNNTLLSGWSAITGAGLATAFEIIYSGQTSRYICCTVNIMALHDLRPYLDARFVLAHGHIKHRQSGAKLAIVRYSTHEFEVKMYRTPSVDQ